MLGNSWKLVQQKEGGTVLDLKSNLVTFGRQRSCTFPFQSNYLSRNHAKMHYDGTQWAIMDENSLNGVFVKAHQIPSNEFVALSEGDLIGIGMPVCPSAQLQDDYHGVYMLQRATEEPPEPLLMTKEDVNIQTGSSPVIVPIENNVEGAILKRKTKHSDLVIILSSDDEDAVENGKKSSSESGITSTSYNTAKEMEFEECKYSQDDEIIEISDDEDEVFQIKNEADVKTEYDEEEGIRFNLLMQEQLDWNGEFSTSDNYSTTSNDNQRSDFWCPPSPELEIIENEDENVEQHIDENVSATSVKDENYASKFSNKEELHIPPIIPGNITGNITPKNVDTVNIIIHNITTQTVATKNLSPENIIPEISHSSLNLPVASQASVGGNDVLSETETIGIFENGPNQIGYGIDDRLISNGEQFFPVLSQDFEESIEVAANENSTSEKDNEDFRLQQIKTRIAHRPIDRLKQSSRGQRSPHLVNAAFLRKQKAAISKTKELYTPNWCSGNKTKNHSIQDIIKKQFGNRIRAPGGGSAIRIQASISPTERFSDKVGNMPSTSGRSAVTNTNNKSSGKLELFTRPEAKTSRPKVYQKSGASRNEKLAQAMGSDLITKPLLKRPAFISSFKSQPVVKKPHLTSNGPSPIVPINEISQPLAKKPHLTRNGPSPIVPINEISQTLAQKPRLTVNGTSPEVTRNDKSCLLKEQTLPIFNTSINESLAIIPKGNGYSFIRPIKSAESILRNYSSHSSFRRNPRQVCFNEKTEICMVDNYITKETVCSPGLANYKHAASRKRKPISPFILTVLNWNCLWLHEQKQFGDCPPLFSTDCLQKVKNSYSSPDEYKKTYGSLIAYESWNEISEQNDLNKNPLNLQFCLKEYKYDNSGKTQSMELYGYGVTERIEARELRIGWLGTLCIYVDENLSVEKQKSSCSALNNENESTSNQNVKSKIRTIFAYAEEFDLCSRTTLPEDIPISLQNLLKNQNNLVFKLTIRAKAINLSSQCKDKPMRLKMISYLLNHVRIYDAVHSLDSQILGNLIVNWRALNLLSGECLLTPSIHLNELNRTQKDTVLRVTETCWPKIDVPNICLIHGPPGTGKTKVITAIIRELLIQKDFQCTFLVCAPSNSAVDEITRRIIGLKKELKEKKISHIHLVRVNQHQNMEEEIREYTVDKYLERMSNASQQTKNVNPYVSSIDRRRDVLRKANVITTTLGSCCRSEMDILHSKSIICIIDEATQCVEPEAILPLSYPVKKLILVGDHKQLPATVKSMPACVNLYHKSLFERLFYNYSKKHFRAICSLNVQYRMHNEICSYPSTTFYDGKLLTAKNLNLRNDFPFQSYHVFNVFDGQEVKIGKDIVNQKECDFVYKLCQVILKESKKRIGIITFYSAQKTFLDKRKIPLLQDKSKYVEINTVDAFQGREKDVIILSAVRANANQNIGFTSSCNRINVALTRGRYALYIIGHLKTLQSNEDWKRIFEDAGRRNKLTVVTSRFDNNMIEAMLRNKAKHA